MKNRLLLSALVAVTVSGCAALGGSRYEGPADYYARKAAAAHTAGDASAMFENVEEALRELSGPAKLKPLFSDPAARAAYVAEMTRRIDALSEAKDATRYARLIDQAVEAGALGAADASALSARLTMAVASGNLSGKLPFTLGDSAADFPILSNADQQQAIVGNTIRRLQSASTGVRPVDELMRYAARAGKGSPEWKRVEAALPSMNIRRDELGLVAPLYPEFAATRRAAVTARVHLQVRNADRLFLEDLKKEVSANIGGIEWERQPAPGTIVLTVERLRHDERIKPESTETVIYRQHEVDFISAVMLMPQNASYAYDIRSGGAEIDYGYALTAEQGGRQIADELIRGKLGSDYAKCQNARIQNVFGGVTRAEFIANADMRARCREGSQSIEDLRARVLDSIVQKIAQLEPIKAVQ